MLTVAAVIGSVANHLWWGFIAYVAAVQVHNGLIHIGNMIGGSTKLVVDAAKQAKGGK